jgi:diguanylate cyclase (GGDEF)-like protein
LTDVSRPQWLAPAGRIAATPFRSRPSRPTGRKASLVAQPFDGESTDAQRRIRIRPVGQGKPCLILMTGGFPGETFLLNPSTEVTVGRGPTNHIRLPHGDVSRVHAKAACSASGKVEITDLGSTNGTYVNGQRQLYRVLREGDKIQFGEKSVFRFAFHDEVDEEFQARLFGVPFLDRASNTLNRDRFVSDLRHAHESCAASGADLAVVAMAIDGFDLIEELLGYAVRDYFIRELGWIIRKTVAGEAALYRVENDAFATIFTGLAPAAALEAAERIRSAVASSRLTHEGDQMAFSLGLGMSLLQADAPPDAEAMLSVALARCRQANAAGGDRVETGLVASS